MTLDADQIVDRRRLRRKLSFWRVAAFLALAVAVVAGVGLAADGTGLWRGLGGPQIARVTVSGFIGMSRERDEMFEKLAKDDSVKAVIVAINSTGGSTAGGEELYEGIRKLAAAKPTVATMGTVAASAAYMAAIATDHIVARRSSITGSIGVLFEYPEVSQLLDKLGVNMQEIKSGPLKSEPSPFRPATPEGRAVIQALVADTYRWFVGIVAERRALEPARATELADGRVFTGQQALEVKLVDALGGEEAARDWLLKQKGIAKDIPVKDWKPRSGSSALSLSESAVGWIARRLGLPPEAARLLGVDLLPERLKLDGLLSLWQGSPDHHAGGGATR